jgi:hypothetical protein
MLMQLHFIYDSIMQNNADQNIRIRKIQQNIIKWLITNMKEIYKY